ncbi:MAG: fructose-bisphosphate aldolase [Candidatus Syntrophoarchaeum caldarius]|uniref:Fructose-bisphosphate aldolase n=1 Tax=Candidatus Syntropharchaeum caldarium TaxID=1838285 RepID=A0A1F2P7Z4_9EURY|nr:MAG: fructose-bisphosphate aldolase [Candidatus Syntrophoarchaeum caldarius]
MEELIKYGRKMVISGLVDSHFGNVSKRIGDRMQISTTGSMLDELEGEIISVPIDPSIPDEMDVIASSEVNLHRKVYEKTSALAILHGHSRYAVALSMIYGKGNLIVPEDSESLYLLHEIPVVGGGVGSDELAEAVADALKDHKAAIAEGHGTFARGSTVDEAFVILSSVEHACCVKYLVDTGKKGPAGF